MTVAAVSGLPLGLGGEEFRGQGGKGTQNHSMNCVTHPKTGCSGDWIILSNTIIILFNFTCYINHANHQCLTSSSTVMAWHFDEIQTILPVHSLEDGNNHPGENKMIFLLMCTSWMASVVAQHQGLEWCQMESGYVFLLGLAPVQTNWLEQPIWLWPTEHELNDTVLRSCTIGDQPCTMEEFRRSHSPSSKDKFS